MSRWRNKAVINLLKNSKENSDHSIAAKEWEFTGTVIDHLTSNHRCQLCEGENLRYHFEIKNKTNNECSLLVGSSCIKKFDITVFDEGGNEIFGSQKSTFLQKKIEQKKKQKMLEQVRSLWKVSTFEERNTIEYYVDEYKIKNGFSPDNLNELFSLMEKHKIDFAAVLFKVSLRCQSELNSLLNMSEQERSRMLPSLSVSQKKRVSVKLSQTKAEQETESNTTLKMSINEPQSFGMENSQYVIRIQNDRKKQTLKNASDSYRIPDKVTCSICGKFKSWASFNPNICSECLRKKHRD